MSEIILSVVTTIAGTFLGLLASKWDSWNETRKRGDLRGEWFALSHGSDDSVVRDKVIVSRKRGKLYLINTGNDFGYSYEAYCTVESNFVLHGTWRSTRLGSSLTGRFIMIVNPQGDNITGVYTGKDSHGKDLFLGWQLSRKEKQLASSLESIHSYFKFPE